MTSTASCLPTVPVPSRREPRWVSLGEGVAAVFNTLFTATRTSSLPPDVLRDHDPALHRALGRLSFEHERERLASNRPPMLY